MADDDTKVASLAPGAAKSSDRKKLYGKPAPDPVDPEDREIGTDKLRARMKQNALSRTKTWAGDEQETDMGQADKTEQKARGFGPKI